MLQELTAGLDAESARSYWRDEGLDQLVAGDEAGAIPPHVDDLVRLHRIVRKTMACTVLEFGVGYSTAVLAHALALNESEYRNLREPPKLRARAPFHLHSVDASETWIAKAQSRVPEKLRGRVTFCHSGVSAGTWNGQLCHFYDRLPDIVPDFVYLDGPDPAHVTGNVRGLSFAAPDRTVMAADLLTMESTLLPGATILVDGRINNARFLRRNFQRAFAYAVVAGTDVSIFRLDEEPLGPKSVDLAALVVRKT